MDTGIVRALSAMRPLGRLHIGHYFGALTHWKKSQYEYECFFMVADVHSLIHQYTATENLAENINEMVIDWLASGINPSQATIFVQSKIPEHFELATLLGAITPISWLERVPSYKERIEAITHTDTDSYGLLGASLLQSSDIITYNAKYVITEEEQSPNIELTREIARRFNHLFGRDEGFEKKAVESIKKLGTKKADLYEAMLTKYQQDGDEEAVEKARFLLQDAVNLSNGDRARLFAFLENKGKVFLQEPQIVVSTKTKLPGIDGAKMSSLASNAIELRELPDNVSQKIRGMTTDPARIRRTDRGNPNACPVWTLHKVYSNDEVRTWVEMGCLSAGIGCLDCKQPLIDAINKQQAVLIENAKQYTEDQTLIKRIINDGCSRARDVASDNLKSIKQALNMDY